MKFCKLSNKDPLPIIISEAYLGLYQISMMKLSLNKQLAAKSLGKFRFHKP